MEKTNPQQRSNVPIPNIAIVRVNLRPILWAQDVHTPIEKNMKQPEMIETVMFQEATVCVASLSSQSMDLPNS
jgi:hypothetical protein